MIVDSVIHIDNTGHGLLYILADKDPTPINAALRSTYGAALCVTRSVYSYDQAEHARAVFLNPNSNAGRKPFLDAGLNDASFGIGPSGQEQLIMNVAVVTPKLSALIADEPDGLIDVRPWLSFVR